MAKASRTNGKAKAKHTSKPTKANTILKLLRRPKGASLSELAMATGWQNHSVRGFLSGTVRKRMLLNVASETSNNGTRRYRIMSARAKVS